MITGMNHFTVIAEDEQSTLDFCTSVLGLTRGHRPDLGFPGAWLYAAKNLNVVQARFDERGIKYDPRQQAGAGTWQLFCHDPNGAKVELDFDSAEKR